MIILLKSTIEDISLHVYLQFLKLFLKSHYVVEIFFLIFYLVEKVFKIRENCVSLPSQTENFEEDGLQGTDK